MQETPTQLHSTQLKEINEMVDKVVIRQLNDFGQISTELKKDGTLITSCDRWSDEFIVREITRITSNQEGVLSEEGSKIVPNSQAYWVVDPLDGTTNFAAGIPHWGISIARFAGGSPQTALLDIPALKKRILAIRGKGVWVNNEKIDPQKKLTSKSECVSLCSRSINVLQKRPSESFPGKIRLLGVSSLNMLSVAIGQTFGALEATPKIWDIAAAWLILTELKCPIRWLDINPTNLDAGRNLSQVNFPLITAISEQDLEKLVPWSNILMEHIYPKLNIKIANY
ncbi:MULTISPECIES: inositol monophosphatase family protein [Prochlorococcus]|uniref:inositol monophosphatase family protein n=1 Tax=Prochlorococcus TaxID=1218 RepID=UPI0005338D73|nr:MULTISPECIES: inositol monophosphatase family protein [Prochlorococcus]KGG13280.1 Histidinol-phosphatasee (alternative form) [Prochlorococcus sp. MIT 0601]